MNDIKKAFNFITIGTMILDVIFVILGIFLVANPTVGVNASLFLFGVVLIMSGLYSIVKYFTNNRVIFRFELIYGIISLIAGLLAFFKPFAIANLITVLIGSWLIISSVFKFFIANELRRVGIESWTFDMGISVLTIILGIMLIVNPFNGYIILTTYVAILIIMYAGFDLVEQLFIRKRASKIIKFLSK